MIQSYIIRLSDHPFSKELSEEAYNEAVRLDYNVEYFEGIQNKSEISLFFLDNNLIVNKDGDMDVNWGTRGCFASHYTLWKQSYETGEPLIIMEHDGYPIRNPEHLVNLVEHACHLDYHIPFNSKNGDESEEHFHYYNKAVYEKDDDGVELYPINSFYGNRSITGSFFRHAYGYIIKPKGAERVLKFIDKHGAFPADQ
jgi:GR25 family glycosyltransferase involved in LPS biosynthesis